MPVVPLWGIFFYMKFIETSFFTKQVTSLFKDDEYAEIQGYMIKNPDIGDIISGSGGIREFRWSLNERGKRGGVRILYYWHVSEDVFYMLLMYPKGKQANLTKEQLKQLRSLVQLEFD